MAAVKVQSQFASLTVYPLTCMAAREFTRGDGCATGASSSSFGRESRRDAEGADSMPPCLYSPRTPLFLHE